MQEHESSQHNGWGHTSNHFARIIRELGIFVLLVGSHFVMHEWVKWTHQEEAWWAKFLMDFTIKAAVLELVVTVVREVTCTVLPAIYGVLEVIVQFARRVVSLGKANAGESSQTQSGPGEPEA